MAAKVFFSLQIDPVQCVFPYHAPPTFRGTFTGMCPWSRPPLLTCDPPLVPLLLKTTSPSNQCVLWVLRLSYKSGSYLDNEQTFKGQLFPLPRLIPLQFFLVFSPWEQGSPPPETPPTSPLPGFLGFFDGWAISGTIPLPLPPVVFCTLLLLLDPP